MDQIINIQTNIQLPSIWTIVWNWEKHDFSLVSWGTLGTNEAEQWSSAGVGKAFTVALVKSKDRCDVWQKGHFQSVHVIGLPLSSSAFSFPSRLFFLLTPWLSGVARCLCSDLPGHLQAKANKDINKSSCFKRFFQNVVPNVCCCLCYFSCYFSGWIFSVSACLAWWIIFPMWRNSSDWKQH